MGTLFTGALLALVLAGCTSGDAKAPPTGRESVTLAASNREDCDPPHTSLTVGPRNVSVPNDSSQPPSLTVRVGDTIQLRATGDCAYSVTGAPQNSRLRAVSGPGSKSYQAVRPGVVDLAITMPMCARPPTSTAAPCAGGVRLLGIARLSIHG